MPKKIFFFGIPAGFVPGSTNNTFRDCKTRSELYPGLNYTFFFSIGHSASRCSFFNI